MKSVTFSCHYLLFLALLSFTHLSNANPYTNNEFDWAKALSLSAEQQQQIKEVESNYRTQHQGLKSHNCLAEDENMAATNHLKQMMHQDIHNILTAKQKQQASEIIQSQHRQMQLRHAREIAHQLNMDSAQRLSFLNAIEDVQYNYQWPLNVKQRELARTLFEQIVTQHLNIEQLAQWQKKSDQRQSKWHRSDEFQTKCSASR